MLADYSVELGPDDPALELPWRSDDRALRYYDLKNHPELLLGVPEALAHPELSAFLARINAKEFPLESAKCDVWLSREILPEEEIFFPEPNGSERKFASYVDLLFSNPEARLSFDKQEALAQSLCKLLKHAPEIAAAVEFVIRRCYYHPEVESDDSESGFYFTVYVSAFGSSDDEARKQWTIALALVQNALVQVANHF